MAHMFARLNSFIARLDADPSASGKQSSNAAYGFQILRNTDASLSLEPWFDFIIGINGRTIDRAEPELFATEIRNCAGSTVNLGVYSAKGQQIREIYASIPTDTASLGLTLQWTPLDIVEDVWHILDVIPNSPADAAGLLPYSDYVIGSPEGLFKGDAGLGELIEASLDRALRLWVYNHEYDVTRLVTITPAKNWGGEGALGCVLGYGALHRVPAPLNEPTQAPGETLFDGETSGSDASRQVGLPPSSSTPKPAPEYLVPANMPVTNPSPPPSAPPGRHKKARAHHNPSPAKGLDDYFKEGEEQSRELDNAPTPKAADAPPPPPPKASKEPVKD